MSKLLTLQSQMLFLVVASECWFEKLAFSSAWNVNFQILLFLIKLNPLYRTCRIIVWLVNVLSVMIQWLIGWEVYPLNQVKIFKCVSFVWSYKVNADHVCY